MAPDEITTSRKTGRPKGYIANYHPQQKTIRLLGDAIQVINDYRAYWPLTVRQIFYRLIGAFGYDKSETFYERLCSHMANARRAKRIPFAAIRDDGVSVMEPHHFDDENHFWATVRDMSQHYTRNKLASQNVYIEVWCEAAGMVPQLAIVGEDYSIPVYSSSGFDSLTAKKDLARRICAVGKHAVILHLGDCDPSGASIYDVIAEDVAAFVEADKPWGGVDVRFQRVALTHAQVEARQLPTAPPKATDSRTKRWTGETCQLEALPPDQIAGLLRAAITELIDADLMATVTRLEHLERSTIAYALPSPHGDAD